MVVLKVIPSEWRLFWVLEVIGLSVTFALLGLRVTGNGGEVSKRDHSRCTFGVTDGMTNGCFIYSWYMILELHPISITIVSLLINAVVASPRGFMERHVFRNCSWQEWLYVLLLALWILEAVSYELLEDLALNTKVLFFALYTMGLVTWVIFKTYTRVFCRGSDRSTNISISFLWTSSASIGLFYVPAGLFLSLIVQLVLGAEVGLAASGSDMLDPRWDSYFVLEAFGYLICEAWMVWGVLRKGSPAMASLPEAMTAVVAEEHEPMTESHNGWFRRLSPSVNLLLGWVHINALHIFLDLCWSELVRPHIIRTGNYWFYFSLPAMYWFSLLWAGVCAAGGNTKGIAFWFVANVLLEPVVSCAWILKQAAEEGIIK